MRRNNFYLFLSCCAIFFIFRQWFFASHIIGGDWPYYYDEFLKSFSLTPVIWSSWLGNGLGGINPLLGLGEFVSLLIVPFTQWLHLPWTVVYKIGWFGLFLFCSVFSIRTLLKAIIPSLQEAAVAVASLIYATNTYVLMVTGGGQMGVALSYALAPLVIAWFIKMSYVNKGEMRGWVVRAGGVLALQVMLDPRIAFVTLIAVGGYLFTVGIFYKNAGLIRIAGMYLGSGAIALLLNAFWVLPLIFLRNNPLASLGGAFTSTEAVRFFSFADFSHALSLLHPNWPENIFGKVYFLQPEFLFIPLVAFGGLLFVFDKKHTQEKNIKMLVGFFGLLGLVGVFFVKGANPPWGNLYVWMFDHIPGFVMFRDPTKFFLLTIVSYTVMTAYILNELSKRRHKRFFYIVFVIFWLFTIRPAVAGKLGGTFGAHTVPGQYGQLRELLLSQPDFSRTLWVPRAQRFAFASLEHPASEAVPLLSATNSAELTAVLTNPQTQVLLAAASIKYLIIPYDALGELFLSDRKYDERERQQWEVALDSIPWLKKVQAGKLTLYETPTHKDHFWLETGEPVSYTLVNQGKYLVRFSISAPTTLHFSETFHPGWVASHGKDSVASVKSAYGFNSFFLDKPGAYAMTVSFGPQRFVQYGSVVSIAAFLCFVVFFILFP